MSIEYCDKCGKLVDTDFVEWEKENDCCMPCYENIEEEKINESN